MLRPKSLSTLAMAAKICQGMPVRRLTCCITSSWSGGISAMAADAAVVRAASGRPPKAARRRSRGASKQDRQRRRPPSPRRGPGRPGRPEPPARLRPPSSPLGPPRRWLRASTGCSGRPGRGAATARRRPTRPAALPAPGSARWRCPRGAPGPCRSDGTFRVSQHTAMPSSSVSRAFDRLPGVSSTISAEPSRRTIIWTACWKTVIGKRFAHQRAQPWVWGSTHSSAATGARTMSMSMRASRISIWKHQQDGHDAVGQGREDEGDALLRRRSPGRSRAGPPGPLPAAMALLASMRPRANSRVRLAARAARMSARQQLHHLVVGAAGVLLDHDVEAAPHDDDGQGRRSRAPARSPTGCAPSGCRRFPPPACG